MYVDNAQYDQAISGYQSALDYYLAVEGEGSTNVATIRNDLGRVWTEKGEYDKAIEYYEQAMAVDRQVFGDEHPNVATDWNNLGSA